MTTKTINVKYLARVEGEGALYLKIRNDKVEELQLKIFEPPRFFEAFMRGRNFREAPDITARICGICPVAYQMSSVHAMEKACEVTLPEHIRQLRRLLYCGEWIESHTLHVYMLSGPDFLGYPDAVALARDHRQIVERGLKLKKAGNSIVNILGGREIHPINVKVGGFYRLPDKESFQNLRTDLEWAKQAAVDSFNWVKTFDYPECNIPTEYVSLKHASEYPFSDGRIASSAGIDIAHDQYEDYFFEEHQPHSTALHSRIKGRGTYLTGPIARIYLNREHLGATARELADGSGYWQDAQNPFRSIMARSLEIVFACEEALRIIEQYDSTLPASIDVQPKAGSGCRATEAPRGLLYHRYNIDEEGNILDAKIVPPTSQNQGQIESDLRHFVSGITGLPKKELTLKCEMAIRNYDPCISCATHFLNLDLDRDGENR